MTSVPLLDQVGAGGVGYLWSVGEGDFEEELRHSVAPIPADKLTEVIQAANDEMELLDVSPLPPSGELQPDSNSIDSEDNFERDDYIYFEKEVLVALRCYTAFCGIQLSYICFFVG